MPRQLAPTLTSLERGFHALSDVTRLQIIEMLRSGERCVCELTDALDAAQSRLSFHLKTLKDAGLVADRREGRWVYYTLDAGALHELETYLADLRVETAVHHGRPASRSAACCD